MKIWNTKYALTAGVTEHEVEEPSSDSGLIVTREPGKMNHYLHGDGREWHRTRESAVAKANDMKRRKIESLKKQIAAIEKKVFE